MGQLETFLCQGNGFERVSPICIITVVTPQVGDRENIRHNDEDTNDIALKKLFCFFC